ncbi:hypothetical protein PMAYCL1PPCAC_04972, partial [Pristionchus mayeri]
ARYQEMEKASDAGIERGIGRRGEGGDTRNVHRPIRNEDRLCAHAATGQRVGSFLSNLQERAIHLLVHWCLLRRKTLSGR